MMETRIAHRHNKIKRTTEDWIVDAVVYIGGILIFLVTFYPFYLAIVLAFNEGQDATHGGIYFWPRAFTLENFEMFLRDPKWVSALGITAARTVLGTALTTLFTCFVAYGLAERELVGRKIYMSLIIFAMYFHGGVIPYYALLRSIKLSNTFWVYIIPGMLSTFYVLVSISFFQSVPRELPESARIDGAGEMSIFIRIILPISKPLLATIAIFTAVGHWNSWYDSAFFVQNKNLRTMGYQLMAVINQSAGLVTGNLPPEIAAAATVTTMSVQLAAMIIAVAPILLVYPFFQRYFVSGLSLGAVKG